MQSALLPDARLAEAEVLRVFPTFVWNAQLKPEIYRDLNAEILRKLDALRPRDQAAGIGWQSGYGLHTLDEFRPLIACICWVVEQVLEFLRIRSRKFEVTGCWANVNSPGVDHKMHAHPNNFLSGVYYVQVQEGADTINFHDPRPQTAIMRPPVTELTAYNTDQVVVNVRNGTLLLFPAWLPHSVDVNRSDRERISISFNIMFGAFAETMSRPLWGRNDPMANRAAES
jgi:uncharacterized protein (TIGR02466 family)